jgi:chemotaxis protein histidine kinase CheA
VSHGIETPAERNAAGKPPAATLRLSASASGETVVIEIADDGRGIDASRVVERAKQVGLAVPSGHSITSRCSKRSARRGFRRAKNPIASAAAASA